ncbi:MAG TPA: hypothetical protein VIW22_03050, partial [Nitrososphaerales archaeon]
AGPLWLGTLIDDTLAVAAEKAARRAGLTAAADVLASLVGVDVFPPWSYDIDEICSLLKVPTVSESEVRKRLESSEYTTFRQPFELTGLKTDADFEEVKGAVQSAATESRVKSLAG